MSVNIKRSEKNSRFVCFSLKQVIYRFKMLTLDQIRKLDPSLADVPDEELLMIRDGLYGVANIALDAWQEKGGSKIPSGHLPK